MERQGTLMSRELVPPKTPLPPPLRRVKNNNASSLQANVDEQADVTRPPEQLTYSCESLYLQCYDPLDDTDSMSSTYSEKADRESRLSTMSADYYRPTRGSIISMDKILDHTESFSQSMEQVYGEGGHHVRSSISPSMQFSARRMVPGKDGNFQLNPDDSHLSQVSASMEFPDETDFETESASMSFFPDRPEFGDRDKTSSVENIDPSMSARAKYQPPSLQGSVTTSAQGGSQKIDSNRRDKDCNHVHNKSSDSGIVDHSSSVPSSTNERVDPVGKNSTWSLSTSGSADHHKHLVTSHDVIVMSSPDGKLNESEPILHRRSSDNSQSALISEYKKKIAIPTTAAPEIDNSNVRISQNTEGELGLESLRTSKAEKIDKMYKDRNDESESEENICLWIFLKLFTWTILVLTAASVLICAKVSVVALSNAMLTRVNVTALRQGINASSALPTGFLALTLNQTDPTVANYTIAPQSDDIQNADSNATHVISTLPTPTLDTTRIPLNTTQPTPSSGTILTISSNITVTTTGPTPSNRTIPAIDIRNSSLPTSSEMSGCDSVDPRGSFVYSASKRAFIDKTVVVIWMFLLMVPAFLGMLSGLYTFIRWQTVRRARLSWKAVFMTVLASLIEVAGSCIFMFEVLPLVSGTWGLLLPSLFMVLPSAVRLYQNSHGQTRCTKITISMLTIIPYLLAISLLYLIISGVVVFSDGGLGMVHSRLVWILPLAVLPVSAVWTPAVLTWQVDGTYTASEVDNLDVLRGMDQVQEHKSSGLRAKQKMLDALCRFFWYPLVVFATIVSFEGYPIWLEIQHHMLNAWPSHIAHHRTIPYLILNLTTTIFSPLALWVVFTAAIELKLKLRATIQRPVSGSFFVLVITVLVTMCLSLANVPCVWRLSDECCHGLGAGQVALIVTLTILLVLGNLPVIYNVMIANHAISMPIYKVFTLATTNPVLMDPWVWLNISSSSLLQRAKVPDFRGLRHKSKIYICTTMYRENEKEMLELLGSIKRINDSRGRSKPLYEAHVFFDGALSITTNGHMRFNGFALQLIALVEKTFKTELNRFGQKSTPYGIQWEVPLWCETDHKPMMFYIHLKDNSKVKKKKRWSQIMYMVWAIEHEAEVPVEDRYVLITDGDTKFYEKGPVALLDTLLISPEAAAVVGRVRPIITSSPLVWYQVFEYAASFWMYKASNDQLGTDLCCSGCFTMYRGSMLREVIKDYATEASNARDFLMIDMGEDLWLSTLLIRSGYKLKYSSVADVYTQAPSKLEEYYKQRRRWYLSSLAYFFFFIRELSRFKFGNRHVTLPYLFYQGMLLCFPLISTSTLGMALAVAQSYALMIPLMWSCILVTVIFGTQHLICFFFSSSIQIKASAVLSIIPSLATVGIVVVVMMNSCKDYIKAFSFVNGTTTTWAAKRITDMESPVPLPTVMLTILVALILCTGLLHPKEFYYVFYVVFYVIGNPLGYIFLRPYMLCNVTDQSWGTRESKMVPEDSVVPVSTAQHIKSCCEALVCCCGAPHRKRCIPDIVPGDSIDSVTDSGSTSQGFDDQLSSIQASMSTLGCGITVSNKGDVDSSSLGNTKVDSLVSEMETMQLSDPVKERMVALQGELDIRTRVYTTATDKEDRFWERLIELKLSNVATAAHKRSSILVQAGLRHFQNRMLVVYVIVNILWIGCIILFWQYFGEQINMSNWGTHIDIVLIIAMPYLLVKIVQFMAMFIHRMGIWLYLVARTKCRIGDIMTCGYPNTQIPDHDITQPSTNQHQVPRAFSKPSKALAIKGAASDGPLLHRASPSRHVQRPSSPNDNDSANGGPPESAQKEVMPPGPCTNSENTTSSYFHNSRWLHGNADRGVLTRGGAARGMMELSASQESLKKLASPRGSHQDVQGADAKRSHQYPHQNHHHAARDPTAIWSHTNTHMPRVVTRTPSTHAPSSQTASSTIVSPMLIPRASPPLAAHLYRGVGDTGRRPFASPLIRRAAATAAAAAAAANARQQRMMNTSDQPTTYMEKLPK